MQSCHVALDQSYPVNKCGLTKLNDIPTRENTRYNTPSIVGNTIEIHSIVHIRNYTQTNGMWKPFSIQLISNENAFVLYCSVHPIKTYNTHKLVESSCTCTLSKSSTTQSKFDYQMCSIQLNWNLVGIWWIAFYLLGFLWKTFLWPFPVELFTPQLLSRIFRGIANGILCRVSFFQSHSLNIRMLNLIEWLRMLMSAELQVSNHYFIRSDSKWIFIRSTHRNIK